MIIKKRNALTLKPKTILDVATLTGRYTLSFICWPKVSPIKLTLNIKSGSESSFQLSVIIFKVMLR